MPTAAQVRKVYVEIIEIARKGDRKAVIAKLEAEIAALAAGKAKPGEPSRFEEFWQAYPRRLGANPRQPALKAYTKALERGYSHEDIITGVQTMCALQRADIGTPYIPQAVTWLNQERWRDHGARMQTVKVGPPPDEREQRRLAAIAENAGFFR